MTSFRWWHPCLSAALAGVASSAHAQALVSIATLDNGDQLFADRATLKTVAPLGSVRRFVATQVWMINQVPPARRSPARSERFHFSFDCIRRTALVLAYRNGRDGTRLQDWQAADLEWKYRPPDPGSHGQFAMLYACNGGRMPDPPKAPDSATPVEDDPDEPTG